ncbi:MAG: hypothetical protein HZA61_11665 [Candidatus Eisenbacteria bacterium]|uniref:Outer membrane protein beta-barrel domain-containing protein n=1 Tax=Eiseniibacteriota bacterium TaxID=2212470 RepID=A0A933SHS0_UNCEI|nr:hypothetical protein [Candidatus Eisenbacteria bacterium]
MKRHVLLWALLGASALLVLHARAAHGGAEPRSWRPATANALEFEIVRGELADFDGATISVRRQHGEHAVWRFGCGLSASRQRLHSDGNAVSFTSVPDELHSDDFSLSAQLTRLTFPWPERRLRPWAGLALGGGTGRRGTEDVRSGLAVSSQSRTPRVYAAALAGLEYALSTRCAMHAQYGQGLQYSGRRSGGTLQYGETQTVTGKSTSWQLYSTGARFGLAVFY